MGSDDHYPEEAPAHAVTVCGFWIDRYQVTNAAFRRFVKATGYVTVAERVPDAALYPGAKPEMPLRLVGLAARRGLAPPGWTRQHAALPGAAPGGPCRVGGCDRVRRLGY